MVWLRKGFVYFLSIVLLVCLLGVAVSTGVSRNLSHPDKLESWLSASKIYDHLTAAALDQSQKSSNDNNGSGSVSLSDPAVQQAAKTAFSPALLQSSVNSFLDSNYAWLSGKTATPNFTIDLSSAKQNFAKLVGQSAAIHLASLPVCTAAQLAQISIPVDSLSITCRPATLSPQAESTRITQSINNSNDLLSNPVITANSLNNNQKSGQSHQPYYQKLSWAPKAYQIGLKLPWILGGLALLSMLGIVFIAPRKRRGVRRVGIVLVEAGIILIIEKLLADALVKKLESKIVSGNTLASQLQQPISDLLRRVESQLAQSYLWFGIFFLLIALVIFVVLFKTRQGTTKPKTPGASLDDTATPSQTDARSIRLAPRRRQPSGDITDLKPAAAKPAPASTPKPIGKNPPRPKPPRLIQ